MPIMAASLKESTLTCTTREHGGEEVNLSFVKGNRLAGATSLKPSPNGRF